jgi:hypothetical protein
MKVKTPPTQLLDKIFWNPRPKIDPASRAVSDEPNFFRLFFRPPKLKIFYLAGLEKATRYQLESKLLISAPLVQDRPPEAIGPEEAN